MQIPLSSLVGENKNNSRFPTFSNCFGVVIQLYMWRENITWEKSYVLFSCLNTLIYICHRTVGYEEDVRCANITTKKTIQPWSSQ